MLVSLALLLCTAAEPGLAPAGLLTGDQIERSPVESLTLLQLHAEEVRLSSVPSAVGPGLMLGIGGVISLVSAAGAYGCFTSNAATGMTRLDSVVGGALLAVIAVGAGLVAVLGGVLLPIKLAQRRTSVERHAAVQARMAAIRAGAAAEPLHTPDDTVAQRDLLALENEKPGLGMPISFMAMGAALAAGGGSQYFDSVRQGATGSTSFAVGITLIIIGIALEGVSTFLLISRVQTRSEIDEKMEELELDHGPPAPPPEGAKLPPVPAQAAFAFHF